MIQMNRIVIEVIINFCKTLTFAGDAGLPTIYNYNYKQYGLTVHLLRVVCGHSRTHGDILALSFSWSLALH